MRRTRMWTILLFSFCMVLISSCTRDTPSLPELAQQSDWESLYSAAKTDFSETYRSGSLYYLALAQAELGEDAAALESIRLYKEIAGEQGVSIAARTLMIILGDRLNDTELVMQQASLLDETGQLGKQVAGAYYRALVTKGFTQKAAEVFTTYLRDQLDDEAYALLLLEAKASPEQIRAALSSLTEYHAVTLFATVAEQQHTKEWAHILVTLAQEYEDHDLEKQERQQLYNALTALCIQADLRVLANKYLSLSQEFKD
ncbi:MAG: hypothetical protein ACQ5SW_12295 [Sphaerochaetaceae bacterium]